MGICVSVRDQIVDIAYELKRAYEEKDLKAIENIYSDDIVVWHNYDQLESVLVH